MSERDIFTAARGITDPVARCAYLDGACGADTGLRSRVEALLRAYDQPDSLLDHPAIAPANDPTATEALYASAAGDRTAMNADEEALSFLTPSARPDSLGRIGHFEVLQVLGQGAFGIVFRAFDEMLQRVVALKIMAPQLAATSPARKRFLREARSSAQIRHENVVQVYEIGEQPLPYLAMEFIPGETLQQKLNRVGPLDVPEVLRIGRQIAEGLAAAHATDLIHRDIKPGNVLLEGGQQRVKITDFGLARTADDASISQSGIIAGTPMYMAPEQAQGQTLDQRADLFSLGSVLYQMVAGRPPFRANTSVAVLKRVAEDKPRAIREIIPETPQWLCDIIAKLHAKNPDERYQSAREVADVLADCEAQLKVNSKLKDYSRIPRSELQRSEPRPRVRIGRWATAAAVLLLLGGLGVTEATDITNVRGTVIRLFSSDGTLVVEVDDPAVSVKIDDFDVIITGAGAKEIRLKPGKYTVEASKDGKLLSRELVTVTKNGKQIVRVSQEPVTAPGTAANNKDPDRRAAEYVLFNGGEVRINGQGQQIKAAADLPEEAFRLTFVSLHGNRHRQVTDAGLAVFKDCKNLTILYLPFTAVGDPGLAHFKDCKALTDLGLSFTQLTDAGLANFKDCKDLTNLNLTCTNVSDVGLAHLKDCRSLKTIYLNGTGVTDAGLDHLKNCKGLMNLVVEGPTISDEGLAHLKECKMLTHVELNQTKVSDVGLAQLEDYKNLIHVQMLKTKVTAAGIRKLQNALPKCRIEWDGGVIEPTASLDPDRQAAEQVEEVRKELMRRNPGFDGKMEHKIEDGVVTEIRIVTDKVTDIAPIRVFGSLQVLEARGTYTDKANGLLADLAPLKGMNLASLKHLNFINTKVTDAGMAHFKDCKDLKYLNLFNTMVTEAGMVYFKDCKRLTQLCLAGTKVSDTGLANFKGKPLVLLWIQNTGITDLASLQGMPLEDIRLTPKNITKGMEIFRDMKSLKTIGLEWNQSWPSAEFWKRYDKGEFK
jgi:serine/threonine protein kinase